jgi:hypothetical protein
MFILDKRDKTLRAPQDCPSPFVGSALQDVLPLVFHAFKHLAATDGVTHHARRDKVLNAIVLIPGIRHNMIYAGCDFLAAPKAHSSIERRYLFPVLAVRLPASVVWHVALLLRPARSPCKAS